MSFVVYRVGVNRRHEWQPQHDGDRDCRVEPVFTSLPWQSAVAGPQGVSLKISGKNRVFAVNQ